MELTPAQKQAFEQVADAAVSEGVEVFCISLEGGSMLYCEYLTPLSVKQIVEDDDATDD